MVNFHELMTIKNRSAGFTLIELMIVVAIIGILASFAYPNYANYREQAIKADTMAELHKIANNLEAQKVIYKRYDKIPLEAIFSNTIEEDGSIQYPNTGKTYYQISITPINSLKTPKTLSGTNWKLFAIPANNESVADAEVMTLDYTGLKCSANKCGTSDEWR